MEVDLASSVSYSSISDDTVSSSEDTEESQNQSDVQSRGRVRGKIRSRGRGASRSRGRGASRGRGRGANSNVDDDWKWENEYNDDTTISAPPEFEEDTGPKYEALECNEPYDFFI